MVKGLISQEDTTTMVMHITNSTASNQIKQFDRRKAKHSADIVPTVILETPITHFQ